MSARSERLFVPELRQLGEKLAVPVPGRVRILRELSGDLHSLTERLIEDGVAPDEARQRATEALVPDDHTLRELERLHEPLYVRLTRSIDPTRLRSLERLGLITATTFVVGASALALVTVDFMAGASSFQLPVMITGALTLAAALAKAFQIWIKGDHSRSLNGVSPVLLLSAAPFALASLGVFADFYRAAGLIEASPTLVVEVTLAWIFSSSLLVATGLLFALAGSLSWFATTQWVSHIENEQREVLGLTGPASPKQGEA